MHIGFIIYRNTNLSILYPIIKRLEKQNKKIILIIKKRKFRFLYKFLRILKLINIKKDYEYITTISYIKNNQLSNIEIKKFTDQNNLIEILNNNKIKSLISVEPYWTYFNKNLNFFKFYLVEWGLDTYLYYAFSSKKNIKVCDYIFSSTPKYQKIGIDLLRDYCKKDFKKYEDKFEKIIKNKSIFTNNLWLDVNYDTNNIYKIQEKFNMPHKNKYIYFQPINEARLNDLSGDALIKFKKYFYYDQKKIIKKIFNFCENNNYKLILKIRGKDIIFEHYKKYSHYFFSNDHEILNLTNMLINLSEICILNKSNSINHIISKNKKFLIYDFIEKELIDKKNDRRYYQYFSEIYFNKFIPKPSMPNKVLYNLAEIINNKIKIDTEGYKKFLYMSELSIKSPTEIISQLIK